MMRVILVCLVCFMIENAHADVFKINKGGMDKTLKASVESDGDGFYVWPMADHNIVSDLPDFNYSDRDVPNNLYQRYPFERYVLQQINKPIFFNTREVDAFARRMESTPLMLMQYSMPASADLFKFYTTATILRSQIDYAYIQALEAEQRGTLGLMNRQGIYSCLQARDKDLVKALDECVNEKNYFQGVLDDEGLARDVDINKEVFNVMGRSTRRGRLSEEIIANFNDIVPSWVLTAKGFQFKSPPLRIGDVFANERQRYMASLSDVYLRILAHERISDAEYDRLSAPGLEMSNLSIRKLVYFSEDERNMVLAQWASALARLSTLTRYENAMEWVLRAQQSPRIKRGYQAVFGLHQIFLDQEIGSFKNYINSLNELRQHGYAYINEANQRIEQLRRGYDHSITSQEQDRLQKGLPDGF